MTIIKKATSEFKRILWVMAFFSLFTNLLMLVIPLYMLQIYDRVLPSQSDSTLIYLSILAVFALLVLGAMEAVRAFLANRASIRLDASLGDTVLSQVIKTGAMSGGNSQPMRDLSAIRSLISSRQIFAVLDLPFASIFIAILYLVHPHLFWLTIGGAVVLAFIAILNQWASSKQSKAQVENIMGAAQQSEFLARNADSLVAMGMISNVIANWGKKHSLGIIAGDKSANTNATFAGLSRFVRLGIQIAILGYGAKLVLAGEMTPGMIFASSIISGRALQPIDQVIGAWRNLSNGAQSWKRLKAFMVGASVAKTYTQLPEPKGDLSVENILQLNAIDPSSKPILGRISFKVAAGTLVAILGPSGSGKSTLARIIVGALKPKAGTIRIDGHDINNWEPEDLGQYVGYLAQDVELLPGTIAQNISRFEVNPSSEKILQAAQLAHVDGLIKSMPNGFDTLIGAGGAQISGGEKQRIGLARAFYGNPKILVLDEPNASLDRIGETALLKAMLEAKKRRISVIVISQRESVLKVIDNILRMNEGVVTDYGPRDAVIAKYKNANANVSAKAGSNTASKVKNTKKKPASKKSTKK